MEENGKEPSSNGEEEDQNKSESSEKEEKKEKKLLGKKRDKDEKKEKKDKKDKKEKKKENDDDIIVGEKEVAFLLDQRKRVTVHKFKGQLKVDIREYYDDNGTMKPGKKGLSLNLDNWNKLKDFIDKIDEAIDNIK